MGKVMLSPSVLSADFSDLRTALKQIEDGGGQAVHIDVMDGQFVPQISFGQPVVQSLRAHTALPFDVHLMVERPEAHVETFALAGADWITFHMEATVHVDRLIAQIHALGKQAGISIVPSTPVSALSEVLGSVDVVLVMTVNPGFGGQTLIPSCVKKIAELVRIRQERGLSYRISVDGGVNRQTLPSVSEAGADIIVSGSAFFDGTLGWELKR
ncbi:MAG: ribulose-phosphate 3-epimerase [Treponema sp.]|nr:ribulose-phosphate 3-epimerase [Treponema sp.]